MTLPFKPIKNAIANGYRKTKTKCQKRIMKIKQRMKFSSDVEPLFPRNDSVRGSKIKTIKMDDSISVMTSSLTVLRAALIILIPDYSECEDLSDLNGVNADGDRMEEMLTAHEFTVEIQRNVVDIEQVVKDFCKKYKNAETLHFHFSGHGVENATVEINPNRYTVNAAGKTFTTVTPAGDCMVGSQGDLYAVHDLTYELMENKPDKVTVTLDCCRNSRGFTKEFVKLKHKRKMSASQQQNIAVIYGTSNLHTASDSNSFTQELYKIYKKEGFSIAILEIEGKINQSWKDCGIKQICKDDIVEVGENWKSYMWPSGKILEDNMEGLEDTADNAEEDFNMKEFVLQMNERFSKLEAENKTLKSKLEMIENNQPKKRKFAEMSKVPSKVRKISFQIAHNAF